MYEAIPGLLDALPDALQRQMERLRLMPWQQTLSAISEVLKHWRWSGQDILPAVAPTIPLHCADEFMCGCARLAREHGIGLHSHVGESKVQALAGMKRYGKTLMAHLDGLGLLGPDFTAAHAVWLDDDDLKRMAVHGASVAHNPGSNMLDAIAPDMKADIVFLDLNALSWIPHNWTANQIVHTEDGAAVRHVMIGDRFAFRGGRHTTIDLEKLAAEAEVAREQLEALNAEWRGLYERLEPVVASFCPAIAAQPYHLRRYLCDAPGN